MTDIVTMSEKLERSQIPQHMRAGLRRYLVQGVPPGGFLTALLSNDLKDTFVRADNENQRAVLTYVQFLYAHAPSGSWGSVENVSSWIDMGGWEGFDRQFEKGRLTA